jgi:hypothetical protein
METRHDCLPRRFGPRVHILDPDGAYSYFYSSFLGILMIILLLPVEILEVCTPAR